MLNLLPEEHKKAYKYAKANVKIGNWIAVFVITILGLLAIVTYGLINMQSASVTYQKHIVLMNKTLSSENLNYTKQEVVNISSSLRLAVQVLSHEVFRRRRRKHVDYRIRSRFCDIPPHFIPNKP